MTGMTQVFSLFRLQKIDTRRDQALARLTEIDKILSNDPALIQAQKVADEKGKFHQDTALALKQAEDAVRSQQIKIEERTAALNSGRIGIPKVLQDMENEIASLKRYLVTLEDHQLELMIALESAEAVMATFQEALRQVQAHSAVESAALLGEQDTLHREVARLDAERQAVSASIPANDLEHYNHLRKHKRGVAIAVVSEDSCQACGAGLTPADRQSARSPSQVVYCSSCGRILYAG